jgi:hypothetical protein
MSKIIISFDGKSKAEVDAGGTFTFIGFERLRRLLIKDAGISDSEIISGLVIDEGGINIRVDNKPKP